jgi:hypothetical protein
MQQQATRSAAFADRSIPVGFGTPSAKDQFAGVLNHDNLTTGNPHRRPRSHVARHLGDTYLFVAQKTSEPHLLGSVPCKASNARARTANEGRMQRRPPFSRRRSPNRPSPISIDIRPPSANPIPTGNQSPPTSATKMCAFDSGSPGRARRKPLKPLRGEGRSVSAEPVCSCAFALCILHMRPRVQRAPGLPCALFTQEGQCSCKPRVHRAARRRTHI